MSTLAFKIIAILVAIIAIAGSLAWFGAHERAAGSAETAVAYQAKIDTMTRDYATAQADYQERMAAVSDAQKAAEARDINEMQTANALLQQQIKEQADEADKDPDADRPAFGADSVRRLGAIH